MLLHWELGLMNLGDKNIQSIASPLALLDAKRVYGKKEKGG